MNGELKFRNLRMLVANPMRTCAKRIEMMITPMMMCLC